MKARETGADAPNNGRRPADEILGYLNFSSGAQDPRFLKNLSDLYAAIHAQSPPDQPVWTALGQTLCQRLGELRGHSEAFRQTEQAEAVLDLVFQQLLPAYRQFHHDLLFHQTDAWLFQPLMIGRAIEAVLRQGGPWDQPDRIVPGAIASLNDYIGHRPVAVLRTQQKIQPYAHEWVCPVPLYVRGAGVAAGPYHDIVAKALEILDATDPMLLSEAMFDPAMLDELSVDPRASDFDHPVNKRPNYLFGQWDMGRLDNSGRCRRFVLQQVSLDAMLARLAERGDLEYDDAIFEAASVLAGTMLMGSGVSGDRPEAHDSSVTLAGLVQRIAVYRDAFYERLLEKVPPRLKARLHAEATALRQPLGGSRQHFNQYIARLRAEQLQRVHLALLFANMGYTEAAQRQVELVRVPSARLRCQMHCRLALAALEIDAGRPDRAAQLAVETEGLLRRAIDCGAMVDPWNILGFGGQYSLFPSPENSVYDHRVDELLELVGALLAMMVHTQREAAAVGNAALEASVAERLEAFAAWWDKFATTEVGSIEGISGRETCESGRHVASALRAWHDAGTAGGDIAFWRDRAEEFRSPKAYAMVVDALLEQRDPVAAMALLVQWLSQAEQIPLVEEDYSFHGLALDWMEELWENAAETRAEAPAGSTASTPAPEDPAVRAWDLSRKLMDYIEANAEEYWQVPSFELSPAEGGQSPEPPPETDGSAEEDPDGLFSAAYEDVTFRGSTDDGFEGETLESGQDDADFEVVFEAERIVARLNFLSTVAQLWKTAAVASTSAGLGGGPRDETLRGWLAQAEANGRQLQALLSAVHRYRVPPPQNTHESLVEFDRRRGIKEMLLEQIIGTCVYTADAAMLVRVVMEDPPRPRGNAAWEDSVELTFRALLRGDNAAVRKLWPKLREELAGESLLYVALGRGGNPHRIVASRVLQAMLRRLLDALPRRGLLREAAALIQTIQEMEMNHPVGAGAITEFDQMFKIGCKAIVRSLVESYAGWPTPRGKAAGRRDADLIAFLEQIVESLLQSWLVHSRGVRLSVLETVNDGSHKTRWRELKRFIERYGHDLFTQRFMNLGNLRAILHQGVETYLRALVEQPDDEADFRLLSELDGAISYEDAVHWLTIALEAVAENYAEYVDYNSTTTQSDRGEMLYTLLDFLRLQTSYDRVAWNLQPVTLAHEVLVRSGCDAAAEIWRNAVAERTEGFADEHLERFTRLTRKYSMRLPGIADRLGERFVRPLFVDQLCALVQPAIEDLRAAREQDSASEDSRAFARLEEGVAGFTRTISGAGFDVPSWLDALEEEVGRVQSHEDTEDELPGPDLPIARVRLTKDEVRRQIRAMTG